MANALAQAPSKPRNGKREQLALDQEFDTNKRYMFQLVERNIERELPVIDVREKRPVPHKEFKPWQNIVLSSQIVWNGGRVNIRYYDGCESIFVSEQPKEKDNIDQLMKQTTQRIFQDGKFGVYGDERMLLLYLFICSWNAESEFRTRTANMIFIPVDATRRATIESDILDLQEKALGYAKEASETKMLIHANFLGIAVTDELSGNDLSAKEIRTEYRKRALSDAKNFIESYGNKKIEVRYYIDRAISTGIINNKFNPNKATMGNSNVEICDISGLRTPDAIAERVFEHSQTEAGEEFLIQLMALYN